VVKYISNFWLLYWIRPGWCTQSFLRHTWSQQDGIYSALWGLHRLVPRPHPAFWKSGRWPRACMVSFLAWL